MTGLSLSEKIISIVIEYIFGVEIRISFEVSLMNFLLLEGILKEHSCTFYICIRTCPLFAYWTEHFVRSFVRIWIWNLLIMQIGQQVLVKVKMESRKRMILGQSGRSWWSDHLDWWAKVTGLNHCKWTVMYQTGRSKRI